MVWYSIMLRVIFTHPGSVTRIACARQDDIPFQAVFHQQGCQYAIPGGGILARLGYNLEVTGHVVHQDVKMGSS